MADPRYNPLSEVEPASTPPSDYQQINASPAAFGGQIGQAVSKFGADLESTGHFFGQVQTDNALNTAMTGANSVVEKFKGLHGADALNAQSDTNQQIDEAFRSARNGLKTAEQQYQFDQSARLFRERYIAGQVSTHANQQAMVYTKNVNEQSVQTGYGIIGANPSSEDAFQAGLDKILEGRVKNAHLTMGESASDEAIQPTITQAISEARFQQVRALLPTDPVAAQKVLNDNRDVLAKSPGYDALSSQVQTASNKVQAVSLADNYLRQPISTPTTAKTDLVSAFAQQESGNRDAIPASANGAVGPMQIMKGTWDQYARPGENIANPADNRAVGARIIEDLSNKFDHDPQRVAVAYFSGPGNVAPAGSPTPWVHDTVDANGKSVSSYVSDISAKLGKSTLLLDKAATLAKIDDDYKDNPALAQQIRSRVTEQYAIANMADQSRALAQQDAQNKAADEYVRGAMQPGADPSQMIRQLSEDPRLTATSREHLFTFLSGLSRREDPNATAYGPGFTQAFLSVNAAAGDPRRINDSNSLLPALAAGQINYHGFEELKKAIDTRNNPGGEGTAALNKTFMDVANKTINPKEFMGVPGDPVGARAMASFQSAYLQAYRDGIAKGYTPQELLTPEGKHSLFPMMDKFKPALGDMVGTSTVDEKPNLTTKDGVTTAYKAGKISYADARNALLGLGVPASSAPQAPISQ